MTVFQVLDILVWLCVNEINANLEEGLFKLSL